MVIEVDPNVLRAERPEHAAAFDFLPSPPMTVFHCCQFLYNYRVPPYLSLLFWSISLEPMSQLISKLKDLTFYIYGVPFLPYTSVYIYRRSLEVDKFFLTHKVLVVSCSIFVTYWRPQERSAVPEITPFLHLEELKWTPWICMQMGLFREQQSPEIPLLQGNVKRTSKRANKCYAANLSAFFGFLIEVSSVFFFEKNRKKKIIGFRTRCTDQETQKVTRDNYTLVLLL